MRCRYCKSGQLVVREKTPTLVTATCTNCSKISNLEMDDSGVVTKIIVPGITTVSSAVAILGFLGVHNMHELIDWINTH